MTANRTYVDVSQARDTAAGALEVVGDGEVHMLNMLRFRDVADYAETPHLAPEKPISGREAYDLYLALCAPRMVGRGNEIVLQGRSGPFLIGPQDERWDMILLVKWPSLKLLAQSPNDEDYKTRIAPHRTAALADSRLLPISAGI